MYYYTNLNNNNECCYVNNRNFCGNENISNYDHNNSHCLRDFEATCHCHPSYYSEDANSCKYKNKPEKPYQCYEGTFKLCPCNMEKNENDCEQVRKCRKQKHCCFCNLFSRW